MANPKLITLAAGDRYGRLTVIRFLCHTPKGTAVYLCGCDCGNEYIGFSGELSSGNTKSCGCLKSEMARTIHNTHGETAGRSLGKRPSPEYQIWCGMISRCENKNKNVFKHYGGRGILVCARWKESFQNFLEDMGKKPPGMTLDRVDNDRGYYKENCAWRTPLQQVYNRRTTIRIHFNGESLTTMEWALKTGISRKVIAHRYDRKWSPERIFTTPVRKAKKISESTFCPTVGMCVSPLNI